MFDLRQERLDEIHEAEKQFLSFCETRLQPEPIAQPGFQLPMSIWALMIGCFLLR